MSDLVYTTVPGKISTFLAKLKQVGVPSKVTIAWLKTIGFTSSNDKSLLGVLRVTSLVDGNNAPTERWKKFRGSQSKIELAEGIRLGYSDLYSVYADAHVRSNTELENVFGAKSSAGRQVISKAVSTFKNLVAEADFSNTLETNEVESEQKTANHKANPIAEVIAPKSITSTIGPSLHIDVQVHVSAEASLEQIDQISASMAKHLYGRN